MKGLLVTYFYPPLNSIASHRTGSFTKYLNHNGHQLDVLTVKWKDDLELPVGDPSIFHASERQPDPGFGEVKVKGIRKIKQYLLHDVFRLKYFIGARPSIFYHEAMEKLKDIDLSSYDYILTSYGPLDCLHIGAQIKRDHPSLKWIIDYRDLYSLLEYYDFGIFRKWFLNFEKDLIRNADGFVTVSKVLREKIRGLSGIEGAVVYNGYEDHQYNDDPGMLDFLQSRKKPVISYTGSLYKGERDIRPFLKYFKKTGLADKFDLVFAVLNGSDMDYLRSASAEAGVDSVHSFRGLSFESALTLQRHSTFVIQFSNFNGAANGYLTGKVFEYIGSGKPIIYSGTVSEDYELYRLIKDYKLGDAFDKIDYDSPGKYNRGEHHLFHRKVQAAHLEEYINRIVTA